MVSQKLLVNLEMVHFRSLHLQIKYRLKTVVHILNAHDQIHLLLALLLVFVIIKLGFRVIRISDAGRVYRKVENVLIEFQFLKGFN